jgi:CRP-like cAMP-binding protein
MAKPYNTKECLKCFFDLFDEGTFSEKEKELLNANRSEVYFKKNEIITKQGSLAKQFVFIQKGLTKSFFEYGSTKQMICLHPERSILGIQGLVNANIFHCTVCALEDVNACMFDINIIKQIAKSNASFCFQLLNINIDMQSASIDRIFSLKLKSDTSKLADVLYCLTSRVYKTDFFDFNFSFKEIAHLTDTPVERLKY